MIKVQMEDLHGLTCSKYSRKLLRQGVDPKEKVEIYRGEVLSLTIKEIGLLADLDIEENPERGPYYRKYRPMTEEAVKRIAQKREGRGAGCV